jgi:hypothetical protein
MKTESVFDETPLETQLEEAASALSQEESQEELTNADEFFGV